MTGQQGILFTILTCKTFNHRCTQIHVLFQRVKTERGMCRACCEGIQTPNALVPLTNANSFHLHSTRATPSNTHTPVVRCSSDVTLKFGSIKSTRQCHLDRIIISTAGILFYQNCSSCLLPSSHYYNPGHIVLELQGALINWLPCINTKLHVPLSLGTPRNERGRCN